MASKQKFIEGDRVHVKERRESGFWEVYAVRKMGRKIRYSVRKLTDESITLFCNVEGEKLEKVEEK
jgi:hypothetical protein